ncbi:MAG: penicillin-binding transpeptidase domain-containing protein [Candidatus Dojkabacteria bacterium]|nr:penicillin-binding transpeptidase domain-containing protein [Candidatus Dojkabacteria bacterium]
MQPASTLKPFLYALAFDKGYIPQSVILDKLRIFEVKGEDFTPHNADLKEHGLQTITLSLANSYNLPAMIMTERLGVESFIDLMKQVGLGSINSASECGIVATVGACEVSLFALTYAYSLFQNEGELSTPYMIDRIEDSSGTIIWEHKQEKNSSKIFGENTVAITQMITNILSDNDARRDQFGSLSSLRTSFPSAAKTGTTQNFKDALTMGYTPEYIVGVWVGNSLGREMDGLYGSVAAAPIWNYSINLVTANDYEFNYSELLKITICSDDIVKFNTSSNIDFNSFNQGFEDTTDCQNITFDYNPLKN